LVLSLL